MALHWDGTSVAVPYSDAIADGTQLVLIKLPQNFDLELLDGMHLNVGKPLAPGEHGGDILGVVPRAGDDEVGTRFVVVEGPVAETEQIVNLFPDSQRKRFVPGRPFSRCLTVLKTVDVPEIDYEAYHNGMMENQTPTEVTPTVSTKKRKEKTVESTSKKKRSRKSKQ